MGGSAGLLTAWKGLHPPPRDCVITLDLNYLIGRFVSVISILEKFDLR